MATLASLRAFRREIRGPAFHVGALFGRELFSDAVARFLGLSVMSVAGYNRIPIIRFGEISWNGAAIGVERAEVELRIPIARFRLVFFPFRGLVIIARTVIV